MYYQLRLLQQIICQFVPTIEERICVKEQRERQDTQFKAKDTRKMSEDVQDYDISTL